MTAYTIKEAAAQLGLTPNGVMYRVKKGDIKARQTTKGWRVYLNGDGPTEKVDELTKIGNELISLSRRLKRAIKEHDAEVRRDTIVDFAASLAESVERGR